MATKPVGGADAPEKTKLELVKEAQVETQAVITAKRLELIEALMEHKSIGGEDTTEESLLELIEKFPKGIQYPFLQSVFPETTLLKAREATKASGKIEQHGKKGNIVLKPVAAK